MEKGFLTYGKSKVHFIRFGQGSRLLIALHGFADRAHLFTALRKSLSESYVVYALDLPFHGKTDWAERHFDRKDLQEIFDSILKKEKHERYDLMGYSMGGRIVQKMLFDCIDKVDKIYLIAPDGLKTKWMFNVNLMPVWFRHFAHWLIRNPKWFIGLLKFLYRLRLISKFIHDFSYYHIRTKERRDRIFKTWFSLTHFNLNNAKVKRLLKDNPVPVEMYFGTRDEVIPPEAGKLLADGLPNVQIHLIEEGHLLIDEKLDELLGQQLSVSPSRQQP